MSRRVPMLLVNLGAFLILVGTFVGWVRIGQRTRSSYELIGVIRRLELAPDGPAALLLRCWPIVPLLVVGAAVSGWWGRPLWSGALALTGALYAGGVAAVVLAVPVSTRVGVGATMVGALILACGGMAELFAKRATT